MVHMKAAPALGTPPPKAKVMPKEAASQPMPAPPVPVSLKPRGSVSTVPPAHAKEAEPKASFKAPSQCPPKQPSAGASSSSSSRDDTTPWGRLGISAKDFAHIMRVKGIEAGYIVRKAKGPPAHKPKSA